ncbi:cbb3-type cytochrome c oxidase N-terminal domain-containing protein [Larkinella bovis]|uniref:Cbb3-type cytochrome c oxidase N-terminal domain-containing protein n=1 Tax=Larkinella bovis TaxID=683041 RepID=A0ABW0I3D8_9BACT
MNRFTLLLASEPTAQWIKIESTEDLVLVIVLVLLLMAGLVLLGVAIFLYNTLKQLAGPADSSQSVSDPRSFWQRFAGLSPLKQEKELMMEHQYDGIAELDNPTPPWFMSLFYGTIAIGIIYLLVYHVFSDGNIMTKEYQQEVAVAEKQRAAYIARVAGSINENSVTVLNDGPAIDAGKTLFSQFCAACHGQNAEGVIGPNLTDEYWLHGGSIKAIFHTITEGVPDKGMVAWKNQLNPLQIQQVSSYILSLQGTKPANAKEPQGEKATAEPVALK